MWSKKHEKCIVCGTVENKPEGFGMCKKCYNKEYRKKWDKRYRDENREKTIENSKKYRRLHLDEIKEYHKKYRKENSAKIKESQNKCRKANPEKVREQSRKYAASHIEERRRSLVKWRKENHEKSKKWSRVYYFNKLRNNSRFKLRHNVSSLVRSRLRFRLCSKNRKPIFSFLPYTVDDLIHHIEKRFSPGMSWNNYGKWHIDHIKPDCSFDYKSVNDEEFQKCWELKNLQPLWMIENIVKGGRFP